MHSLIHHKRQRQAHLKSSKIEKPIIRQKKLRRKMKFERPAMSGSPGTKKLEETESKNIPHEQGTKNEQVLYKLPLTRMQILSAFDFSIPAKYFRELFSIYPSLSKRYNFNFLGDNVDNSLSLSRPLPTEKRWKSIAYKQDIFARVIERESIDLVEARRKDRERIMQERETTKKAFFDYPPNHHLKEKLDILNDYLKQPSVLLLSKEDEDYYSRLEHDVHHPIVTYSWLKFLKKELEQANNTFFTYVYLDIEHQKIRQAMSRVLKLYDEPLAVQSCIIINGIKALHTPANLFEYDTYSFMRKLWHFTELDQPSGFEEFFLYFDKAACTSWHSQLEPTDLADGVKIHQYRRLLARELFELPYPKAAVLKAVRLSCRDFHSHEIRMVLTICEWVRRKIEQMSIFSYVEVQRSWRQYVQKRNAVNVISRWWTSIYYSPDRSHYKKIYDKWIVKRKETLEQLQKSS